MKNWNKFFIYSVIWSNLAYPEINAQGDFGVVDTHTDDGSPIYLRPQANIMISDQNNNLGAQLNLQAIHDVSGIVQESWINIRELYFNYKTNTVDTRVGAQQFNFSETFGVQVSDVANPRNYSDFILNDVQDQKLSSWSISSIWTGEKASFQIIFTPYPSKDLLPKEGSYYDPSLGTGVSYNSKIDDFVFLKNSEYGIRLGYLFANGLDANFIVFRNSNRTPSFELNNNIIQAKYYEVTTLATTVSYAFTNSVLRGDAVYTLNDVNNEYFVVSRENNLKTIVGVDYSGVDNLTLGLQWHYQEWLNLYWYSVYGKYEFSDNFFVDLTHFQGLNNNDQWINPKISFRLSDFIASVEADLLYGTYDDQASISSYSKKNRYLTKLTYEF